MKVSVDRSQANRLKQIQERLDNTTKETYAIAMSAALEANRELIVRELQQIIEEEIYMAYPNYQGQGHTKESVRFVNEVSDGNLRVSFYLDPNTLAAAKLTPEGCVYAAFFEDPENMNSFIARGHGMEAVRYRPFYQRLSQQFAATVKEITSQASRQFTERLLSGQGAS